MSNWIGLFQQRRQPYIGDVHFSITFNLGEKNLNSPVNKSQSPKNTNSGQDWHGVSISWLLSAQMDILKVELVNKILRSAAITSQLSGIKETPLRSNDAGVRQMRLGLWAPVAPIYNVSACELRLSVNNRFQKVWEISQVPMPTFPFSKWGAPSFVKINRRIYRQKHFEGIQSKNHTFPDRSMWGPSTLLHVLLLIALDLFCTWCFQVNSPENRASTCDCHVSTKKNPPTDAQVRTEL